MHSLKSIPQPVTWKPELNHLLPFLTGLLSSRYMYSCFQKKFKKQVKAFCAFHWAILVFLSQTLFFFFLNALQICLFWWWGAWHTFQDSSAIHRFLLSHSMCWDAFDLPPWTAEGWGLFLQIIQSRQLRFLDLLQDLRSEEEIAEGCYINSVS